MFEREIVATDPLGQRAQLEPTSGMGGLGGEDLAVDPIGLLQAAGRVMIEPLPDVLIEPLVRAALAEDLGRAGDITSAACIAAEVVVRYLPRIPSPLKPPIVELIEVFAVGGLFALNWERGGRPGGVKFAYFVTAWIDRSTPCASG